VYDQVFFKCLSSRLTPLVIVFIFRNLTSLLCYILVSTGKVPANVRLRSLKMSDRCQM
jgi:hypothetical protein